MQFDHIKYSSEASFLLKFVSKCEVHSAVQSLLTQNAIVHPFNVF